MACPVLTYSGVGDSEWSSVKEAVSRAYGIAIDSARGEASRRGFKLRWELAGETLRIQCTRKPFPIPCGTVNGRIRHMAEECGLTPV